MRRTSEWAIRLLCGFGALFLSPGRIRQVAIGLRPSTLLTFHQALVRGKYRRLFSASARPKKPGPKGPSEALIRAIVELKSRNPRFGCPRIARIISSLVVTNAPDVRTVARASATVPWGSARMCWTTARCRPSACPRASPAGLSGHGRGLLDRDRGFSDALVNEALAGVEPREQVISEDRNQAEVVQTLEQYYRIRVSPTMVERGRALAAEHASLLARIEAEYGVPTTFQSSVRRCSRN